MKMHGTAHTKPSGLGIEASALVLTDPIFFTGQLPGMPVVSAAPVVPAVPMPRQSSTLNLILFLGLAGAAYYFLVWRRTR